MATKTMVCPDCGEALPYGRLSCPNCGSLLASVAGSHRAVIETRDAPAAEPEVAADDVEDVVPEAAPAEAPEAATPDDEPATSEPDTAETDTPDVGAPDVVADRPAEPRPVPPVLHDPDDLPLGMPSADRFGAPPSWPPPSPTQASWPTHAPESLMPAASATSASGPAYVPAGAYLPPSAVIAPPPAAPARTPSPGQAPLFADLPFDAPDDLGGWLIVGGAGLASVAFLLPWARAVTGSSGVGTYFDSWGLGAPMHWPAFLLSLAVLALALLPNPVPPWLRAGVAGLALGGLLLGLVWPYVVGPLGGQIGALGEAVAALVLLLGGTFAVRPARHGTPPPGV